MSSTPPQRTNRTSLEIRSLVSADGTLQLSLEEVAVKAPGPDQVVVRVEAAPLNPSDLGLLLAGADVGAASASGSVARPVVTAPISQAVLRSLGARIGEPMPVGNEAGGVVVEAGSSPAAQALLGRTVGVLGGAMYAQFRTLHVAQCLALPEGTTPVEGASCFVNPLTALGMVETMRREGHTALVHTAAASNLGQMLNKICIEEGVALVNIVRKPEQAALLGSIGATYVCDSSLPSFMDDLIAALTATGATIAFDATGGGRLAGQILTAMEAALNASATEFSRYGSSTLKQVYIYGGLDRGPTEFNRSFGMAWSIGGWLLTPFLQKIGPGEVEALRERVANGLKTTFASTYTKQVSLAGALDLAEIAEYAKQATGTKYLITPHG
jgi:NADPH:quinone reductase